MAIAICAGIVAAGLLYLGGQVTDTRAIANRAIADHAAILDRLDALTRHIQTLTATVSANPSK